MEVVEQETLGVFGADGALVAAPVAGWETIPATELSNGFPSPRPRVLDTIF